MSDGWRQEQVLLFKIINVTMQAGKNVLVQIQCGKGKTTLIVNLLKLKPFLHLTLPTVGLHSAQMDCLKQMGNL